jgi:hypothetical protein
VADVTARILRLNLALAREGLQVGLAFGVSSLFELVRTARYIEQNVYAKGSLRQRPDGFRFLLHNPPLRLGAFRSVTLRMDGVEAPPESVMLQSGADGEPRPLSEITAQHPVELLPGLPIEFRVRQHPPPDVGGTHTFRLELRNVAIPPAVWMEFRDRIQPGPP